MSTTVPGLQRCLLLFAGETYYPRGGWEDFIGYFPSVEAAKDTALRRENDGYEFGWAHIVNSLTDEIILMGDCYVSRPNEDGTWEWYKPGDKSEIHI